MNLGWDSLRLLGVKNQNVAVWEFKMVCIMNLDRLCGSGFSLVNMHYLMNYGALLVVVCCLPKENLGLGSLWSVSILHTPTHPMQSLLSPILYPEIIHPCM